ncbi:MAG: A24 family peptidase [Acidimicrobiales bacterium]
MSTVRLLVCIALALPCGSIIAKLSASFITDRPMFQSANLPRVPQRTVVITVLTLIVFVLVCLRFSDAPWLEFFAYLLGFSAVLLASVVDLTEYRLPDVIVIPSIAGGAVLVVVVSIIEGASSRIPYAFVGALLAFGVLLVAHVLSPEGMGFGDVKFAALLGLLVGWQASTYLDVLILVLWLFLIGFAVGTVGGIVLLILRGRNQSFPFGPFLAVGTLLAVVLSQSLVG